MRCRSRRWRSEAATSPWSCASSQIRGNCAPSSRAASASRRKARARREVCSLSRLRERVGERVSPQRDNPQAEKALTRRFAIAEAPPRRLLERPQGGLCLSRKRERYTESAARLIQQMNVAALRVAATQRHGLAAKAR